MREPANLSCGQVDCAGKKQGTQVRGSLTGLRWESDSCTFFQK